MALLLTSHAPADTSPGPEFNAPCDSVLGILFSKRANIMKKMQGNVQLASNGVCHDGNSLPGT
jgi:hypothetical protein